MKLLVIYFASLVFSVSSYNVSKYKGYKIFQVLPTTYSEASIIKELENDINFDFWTEVRLPNLPIDIMASETGKAKLESLMKQHNIEYTVIVDDVELYLQRNKSQSTREIVPRGSVTFSDFMRHTEINTYLERLAIQYSNILTIQSIGRSFEGRNLLLVRISSGGTNKTTIYAQAAIHAREWIAPPTALYVIHQLVENPENAYMYRDIDWVIVPVLNADGYEFTHSDERFWRKTRSPGTVCHGVDGNRNFDALWGTNGASSWQCDNNYRGTRVFSELETQAVRDYILPRKDNIKLFLDVHSFGRWLLYPYGYNDEDADNIDDLRTLGSLFNDAVHSVNGQNYTVTSFADGLYYASGTSVDWAKEIGIDLAYTLELPAGGSGFDPPAEDIQPVVEETWEGFKAFHSYIQDRFVNN